MALSILQQYLNAQQAAGTPKTVWEGAVELLAQGVTAAKPKLVTVADTAARLALTPTDVNVGDYVEVVSPAGVFVVLDTAELDEDSGWQMIGGGSPVQGVWTYDSAESGSITINADTHTEIPFTNEISSTPDFAVVSGDITCQVAGRYFVTIGIFVEGADLVNCYYTLNLRVNGTETGAYRITNGVVPSTSAPTTAAGEATTFIIDLVEGDILSPWVYFGGLSEPVDAADFFDWDSYQLNSLRAVRMS